MKNVKAGIYLCLLEMIHLENADFKQKKKICAKSHNPEDCSIVFLWKGAHMCAPELDSPLLPFLQSKLILRAGHNTNIDGPGIFTSFTSVAFNVFFL